MILPVPIPAPSGGYTRTATPLMVNFGNTLPIWTMLSDFLTARGWTVYPYADDPAGRKMYGLKSHDPNPAKTFATSLAVRVDVAPNSVYVDIRPALYLNNVSRAGGFDEQYGYSYFGLSIPIPEGGGQITVVRYGDDQHAIFIAPNGEWYYIGELDALDSDDLMTVGDPAATDYVTFSGPGYSGDIPVDDATNFVDGQTYMIHHMDLSGNHGVIRCRVTAHQTVPSHEITVALDTEIDGGITYLLGTNRTSILIKPSQCRIGRDPYKPVVIRGTTGACYATTSRPPTGFYASRSWTGTIASSLVRGCGPIGDDDAYRHVSPGGSMDPNHAAILGNVCLPNRVVPGRPPLTPLVVTNATFSENCGIRGALKNCYQMHRTAVAIAAWPALVPAVIPNGWVITYAGDDYELYKWDSERYLAVRMP